jgi:hypothetical protein
MHKLASSPKPAPVNTASRPPPSPPCSDCNVKSTWALRTCNARR